MNARFYILSELVIILAALAVLFSVAIGVVILFILAQEFGRWSARRFQEGKHATELSLSGPSVPEMTKLVTPQACQSTTARATEQSTELKA